MCLSNEKKNKIIENNKKITELLKENENILRESGYNPPLNNYVLERNDKIGFPSGYIRTVATFNEKYHLSEICPSMTEVVAALIWQNDKFMIKNEWQGCNIPATFVIVTYRRARALFFQMKRIQRASNLWDAAIIVAFLLFLTHQGHML